MKKLLSTILILIMCHAIFSGCKRTPVIEPVPESGQSLTQPPASVTVPDTATTKPDTTATTSTTTIPDTASATMPVESGGVLLPNGALPEGEYTSDVVPPERYYPETVLGLIPAAGYGRIWPYIGGTLSRMWGAGGVLIGICDAEGRIICDPYYNSAEIIEHGEFRLYAFIKNRLGTETRYYDQYNYSEMPVDIYETTLTTLDGSWAVTYDSVIYQESMAVEILTSDKYYDYTWGYQWRPTVTYDYITAERSGNWGVLDWDGTVLLPFIYPEPVCFHDGLACVLSDDGETVSFIDITGETVLGPYESPPRQPSLSEDYSRDPLLITKNILFNEGLARFYSRGKYGMVDTSGEVIVPAIYEYVTSFTSGVAMTVSDGGADGRPLYGVVNSGGAVIAEGLEDAPFMHDGKAIIDYDWNTYRGVALSPDGTREEYNAAQTSWASITDNVVTYADGHTLTIPGAARVESIDDGRYIAYFRAADSISGKWRLYDGNGNALSEAQPGMTLWQMHVNDDGTGYFWMYDTFYGSYPTWRLYDLNGSPVLRKAYDEIIPIDGYFMVKDGDRSGLIDADENYIIEVSIKNYEAD